MTRYNLPIRKVNETSDETENTKSLPRWMNNFVNEAVKSQQTAADQARERQKTVLSDYLTSLKNIITNRPRYATVDDAVHDMQERTGLKTYLKELKASDKKKLLKRANFPKSLEKYGPKAKSTIDTFLNNYLKDRFGNELVIPLIKHELINGPGKYLNINPADINTDEVNYYISSLISNKEKNIPSIIDDPNLGRNTADNDSDSNSDYFQGLQPSSE